jgi:tetratricopeptide (TPR) repeat protein
VLLHAAQNDYDTAIAKCDLQLEKAKDVPVLSSIIHNLKGGLYLKQRKIDEAEASFKAALEANPNYLRSYYALARIYLAEKQVDKAIEQYQTLIAKDPKQPGPHMLLGTIYDMQKRYDLSEKHYREALAINPEFAPAANNLAYLLSSGDKNIDEALTFARIAKEKLPDDPSVMDTLGWIYFKKGLYENAVGEFLDSLEKIPQNAIVHYHLGRAFYAKGENESARSEMEKALSLDSDFDGADEARKILEAL